MRDARQWLERLRNEAEERRLISKLAGNRSKRESFARLAAQHTKAASELEKLL